MMTDEVLRQATERLVAQFHPQRVFLFGSQARGTADARSDVDLLVICPFDSKWESRRTLMVAMDRALRGLGFARDVIVLTPEEFERDRHIPGTVARPAWREGKVLYEAP
jgi:predicted nucleotidyltransferase